MAELQNIDDSQKYLNWISEIKQRIYNSQQKAMISVNAELLDLYWYIGNQIAVKQKMKLSKRHLDYKSAYWYILSSLPNSKDIENALSQTLL